VEVLHRADAWGCSAPPKGSSSLCGRIPRRNGCNKIAHDRELFCYITTDTSRHCPRSADLRSAVSRVSDPPAVPHPKPCRLEVGNTAVGNLRYKSPKPNEWGQCPNGRPVPLTHGGSLMVIRETEPVEDEEQPARSANSFLSQWVNCAGEVWLGRAGTSQIAFRSCGPRVFGVQLFSLRS